MKQIATAVIAAAIVGIAPGLTAAPSEYEYKVATAELTLLMFDESAELEVKKWAKKHRPKLYEAIFVAPEKEAAKGKEKKKPLSGLISLGTGISMRSGLLLDYYLNQQADEGWDLHLLADKQIILRRKRAKG
ncbi:MAG: hypothetical protein ACR2RV_10780 [Verrucomicrobiales bacterium]